MPTAEAVKKYDGLFYDFGAMYYNVLHKDIDLDPTGSSDNAAKIQAAIDMFPNDDSRKILAFPPGTYFFDGPVDLRRRNLSILAPHGAKITKGTTINHVFSGTGGNCNGLRLYGFEADLNRSGFIDGVDPVSFLFLVRASDFKVRQCYIHNFSEECLKIYKCQKGEISFNRFEDGFDNGVQLHTPEADNYSGSGPDQGTDDIHVFSNVFRNIDDLTFGAGNGIGVTIQTTDVENTIRNIRVHNNLFEDCLRAVWGEVILNYAENISIVGNTSNRSIGTAFGVVGAKGCLMSGNIAYNPGQPGILSSEVAGFQVSSGDASTIADGYSIVGNVAIDDRVGAAREMMYGIVVNSGNNINIGSNSIFGAKIRKVWSISWPFTTGDVVDKDDPPAARVSMSSSATLDDKDVIGSDGYLYLSFDVNEYDTEEQDDGTLGLHDLAGSLDRFTIRRPGIYDINGIGAISYGAVGGGNSGELRARLTLGPAVVCEETKNVTTETTEETGVTITANGVRCDVGDEIKFGLRQDTGAALTVVNTRTRFSIRRVGK